MLTQDQANKINQLMAARKFKELNEYLDSLVQEQKNPEVYNLRGISLMNLSQFGMAERDFRSAIELKPEAVYHANLADSLLMQGKYQEAEKALAAAIAIDKAQIHAYMILSKLQLALNKPEEAIKSLDAGLVAVPDSIDLLRKKEQLMALIIARKKTEDFELTLVDLAHAEMQNKNYTTAIKFCKSSLRIKETKEAHNTLGICLVHNGDWKGAIKSFTAAYSIDKTFYDALRNIASCHLDMNNPKKSLSEYDKLIRMDKQGRWFFERSFVHIRLGNLKQALSDVIRAIELDGFKASYSVRKADILARMKKPEEAIKELKRALEHDPFSSEAAKMLSDLESSYRTKGMFR